MNERIKELVVQAGITTNLDTDFFEKDPNKWVDYFAEKFAELIVRECCSIADEAERADVPVLASKYIKAHFGIE